MKCQTFLVELDILRNGELWILFPNELLLFALEWEYELLRNSLIEERRKHALPRDDNEVVTVMI